jgi:P-type Cu+ transporter
VASVIYSLEKYSSHTIAYSLTKELSNYREIKFDRIEEMLSMGITGEKDGTIYKIGSFEIAAKICTDNSHDLYLLENQKLIATIDLSDEIKPGTKELIAELKKLGLRTILLSGDSQKNCDEIGRNTGIDYIYSRKSPEEKLDIIDQLSKQGPTAMVGDGINDAPALTRASVGISLSDASHIAMQSSQIILLSGNLRHLINTFKTSRNTVKNIKQNLYWAFLYNIIAIPLAMFGVISPMIAAISMALSDVVVVGNSLRFKYKKLSSE